MLVIVGIVVVFGCVFGASAVHGGHLGVLWQPSEFVIILGGAVGALVVSSTKTGLKATGAAFKRALKGPVYKKADYVELLSVLYQLFRLAKTKGMLAFTRFSPFFIEGVHDLYAKRGIILKPVDLSDLVLYITYHGVAGTAQTWGMKPGCLALAKACTRVFQPDGQQYLQQWLGYQAERRWEDYYRGMFRRTGLIVTGPNDVATLFERASEHVSPSIYGEIIPTVGKGLGAESEGYDGIILIGPFNCLPFRISEAILKPLCMQRGMPTFTYESDGYAVSPAVLRQVDVHIQQVLDHAAERELSTAREHEWTL